MEQEKQSMENLLKAISCRDEPYDSSSAALKSIRKTIRSISRNDARLLLEAVDSEFSDSPEVSAFVSSHIFFNFKERDIGINFALKAFERNEDFGSLDILCRMLCISGKESTVAELTRPLFSKIAIG